MTPTTKAVKRRTVVTHHGRRIIVSIEPGDVIGLRQERRRQTEYVHIPALYDYAVKQRVLSEKFKRQQERKANGKRR